jgi:hypothetical protein
MLPLSDIDFFDSEWNEWLARIDSGFEYEKKRLEGLAKGANEEYAEYLAEDYWVAEDISGKMYAALIVSVWSRIELFLKELCGYCKNCGLPGIDEKPNIESYAKYFDRNLGISFQAIQNSEHANILRVLSNSFKHNDGYYFPDSFPVDQELAKKYDIHEYEPHKSCQIKYINLPIKDMIISAGQFCKNLFDETEAALKFKNDE